MSERGLPTVLVRPVVTAVVRMFMRVIMSLGVLDRVVVRQVVAVLEPVDPARRRGRGEDERQPDAERRKPASDESRSSHPAMLRRRQRWSQNLPKKR